MRALSIRQPWAWAILHAGKRVENRDWKAPPRFMIGQTFLIHAAKGCTEDEYTDALDFIIDASGSIACPPLKDMPRGAIVGRARLSLVVDVTANDHRPRWGQYECLACKADLTRESRLPRCSRPYPWAVPGAMGLVLADVERIAEPIPFKGALGFFEVPDALLVGARWEASS